MSEDFRNTPESPETPGNKKPYKKPAIVSEPIYETLALACGKLPGDGGVCNSAARRS